MNYDDKNCGLTSSNRTPTIICWAFNWQTYANIVVSPTKIGPNHVKPKLMTYMMGLPDTPENLQRLDQNETLRHVFQQFSTYLQQLK